MKSLNCSVTVLRGAGGFGGTYGLLVGSEMTRLGGGAFRPSTTADGGTALSPSSVGVIAPLPITKVSRKQRDAMTVGIFIGGRLLPLRVAVRETTSPAERDRLSWQHHFTRSRSEA